MRPTDRAKRELADGRWRRQLHPILYKPFDTRWTVYNPNVAVHRRERVMRHMLPSGNLAIIAPRRVEASGPWRHCLTTSDLTDHVAVSLKNIDYILPLYLYGEEDAATGAVLPIGRDQRLHEAQQALDRSGGDAAAQDAVRAAILRLFPAPDYPRWPNLNPLLLAELEDKLGLRFAVGRGLGQARERGVHEPRAQEAPSPFTGRG